MKPIREIWKSKSRNLVTGKCTSAEVGGRNTEDCFAFLASIKDHRDCGTTYGHLLSTGAPLARTHTRTYILSRSRFNAVSFFNCDSSSLETHPSCRATWIGTSPHLLSPPRHPSSTSHLLSLSFSRYRSLFLSLAIAFVVVLALSLALATHWHEMNLCKGASIDFTEIVFETSCWETFGKFLGWFWMNEAKFRIECSVGGIEVGFLEEDFQFVLLTMNLKVFDQVDC